MSDIKLINTETFSQQLRPKGINVINKSISITNFHNSLQEKDIKEGSNCEGFGRIRTFKYSRQDNWPVNPLPIYPASKALGLDPEDSIRAQVFQNSVCNWRCWYCFVDFKLLSGSKKYSSFKTCGELVDLYLKEPDPPKIIDLTGGQPDITPEWIPWMMEELQNRGLQNDLYLWSDDNLSNDYFWKHLTDQQISLIQNYPNYGRVCCFKGIDETSFCLNTQAETKLFENQFNLADRLMQLNIDLYFYITLTAPTSINFDYLVPLFFDKVQSIHRNLPLRIVPLQVFNFSPVSQRKTIDFRDMLKGQYLAMKVWVQELNKRFTKKELQKNITDIQF